MGRATAPVVAVVLLVAVTVLAASAVGTAALALDAPAEPTRAAVSLSVDAAADRVVLTHRAGPTLNVTRLSIAVAVDGRSLRHQPPVPFFAAHGFRSGPTGPFNSVADPRWRGGEEAGFRLASTNAPAIDAGDPVTVTVRRRGRLVVRARAHAT